MRFVIDSVLCFARWMMGLKVEEVTVGEITWTYLDSNVENDRPIVVVLHGFSSVKESMLRVIKPLISEYRVIMPDLPGHGDTTSTLKSYRAEEQADRLHEFLLHILGNSSRINLMGCSMGGMISGVFASKYPEMIVSLTLICPAGITMPDKSPIYKIYQETGENHMRIRSIQDFDRLRTYMSYRQHRLPRFIGNFVVREAKKRQQVLEELMRDILLDSTVLDDRIEMFQQPFLVVWGDSDKILDISCLEIIKKKAKVPVIVKIMSEAGHIVHQEQHAEVAELVLDYLNSTSSSILDVSTRT